MLQGVREFAAAAKAEIKLVSRPGLVIETVSSSLTWFAEEVDCFLHTQQASRPSTWQYRGILFQQLGKAGFHQG
jgi:hypothetical protein